MRWRTFCHVSLKQSHGPPLCSSAPRCSSHVGLTKSCKGCLHGCLCCATHTIQRRHPKPQWWITKLSSWITDHEAIILDNRLRSYHLGSQQITKLSSWIMDHEAVILDHGSQTYHLGSRITKLSSWITDHEAIILDHGSQPITKLSSWITDHDRSRSYHLG